MKYRLGLDVGTSSVGLVALELDENNLPVRPVYDSLRIFNEPLLPPQKSDYGVGKTKKSTRRQARQARRRHQRRARKLARIAELGRLLGLDPDTVKPDKGQRIHELRAQAVNTIISLEDLLRVLLSMAKRRGYAGTFRAKKNEKTGPVETGIKDLKAVMKEEGCETLGQYLWLRIRQGRHLRLKDDGLYPDRDMLNDEFNRIWEMQQAHHPVLQTSHKGRYLKEHFQHAIIQQRPLKSPAAKVSNCPLEPMLPRAPLAQPDSQAFRIEKQITDLRWGTGRSTRPLSARQGDIIRNLLRDKKEVKFADIYKALGKAGQGGPDGHKFNHDRDGRETLTGDRTRAAMRSLGALEQWDVLTRGDQISLINLLADMGSPHVFSVRGWEHRLKGAKGAKRKIREDVRDFVELLLDTGKFDHLGNMGFDRGRSAYSIKAQEQLTAIMRDETLDEHSAISKAYPGSQDNEGNDLQDRLPRCKHSGNVVVDVALRQVRLEVNAAISKLGTRPSQAIIELNRDMRNSLRRRREITFSMRQKEQNNKWADERIRELTGRPAGRLQIRRYLLWKEQREQYCPYCESPINASDAINGNVTEYEHILPRKLTQVGKNRNFLVLAHKGCNQEKGDMTPWQRWGQDPDRWRIIERRAEQFREKYKMTFGKREVPFVHKGKAAQLLVRDFESEPLDETGIREFTDRQFQETAWVAKECGKMLRQVCADVSVSRGLLTAHLRRIWGLDTVIPEVRFGEGMPVFDDDYQSDVKEAGQTHCRISREEFETYKAFWEGHTNGSGVRTSRSLNKRIDHRHHLVDALVIACTTRSMYQKMAAHYKKSTDASDGKLRLYAPPELKDIRKHALTLVSESIPRHRSDRDVGGNLYKENPSSVVQVDGAPTYCQRRKVDNLSKSSIDKIYPESTKQLISNTLEQRRAAGMSFEKALQEPILHPVLGTTIRRVMVLGASAEEPIRVVHGEREPRLFKYLVSAENAYMEYDPADTGSLPRLVRMHDANRSDKVKQTAKGVIRLFKNDTVRDLRNQKLFLVQQISKDKDSGARVIMSPITEAVADAGKINSPRAVKVTGNQIINLVPVNDVIPPGTAD